MFGTRFFIFLFFVIPFFTKGQGEYRVVIAQGRSYASTEDGFHQLRHGEIVSDSVKITSVENAFLALLDSKGRILTIDETGTYDLGKSDLSLWSEPSDVIYNIWAKFYTDTFTDAERESGPKQTSTDFKLYLPSSSEAYGFELLLKWTDVESGRYRVELLDEFEMVFSQIDTEKSHYKLDLLSNELAWKRQVFVLVKDIENDRKTRLIALAKLSPPDLDETNTLLRKVPNDFSEISILTKAVFFEQKGWFADVHYLLYYRAKENAVLSTFYKSFLERNNF